MPPQFTLPPDTRAVGTGNPPVDMNGVVDALTAVGAAGNVLNAAYAGGADPAGAADSTAAFAAAAAAVTTSGVPLSIPAGTYKITAALNWKIPGLVVRTAGAARTIITQATANTPVVQVAGARQHIGGLTLTYASQEPSANTASNCITFGDDTVGSCFESVFEELILVFGSTGMAIDPSIATVSGLFSCYFGTIRVMGYTISAINLNGNNNNGLANCTGCVFDNTYIHNNPPPGTNIANTSFPVILLNWDEVVFNQLNIEHASPSAQDVLAFTRVNNAVINSLHMEGLVLAVNGQALLRLNGAGNTVIDGWTVARNTFSGSGSNPVVNFLGTGVNNLALAGFFETSNTVTTPSHPFINYGSATNSRVAVTAIGSKQTTVNTTTVNAGCVSQFGMAGYDFGQYLCTPVQYAPAATNLTTTSATMAAVSSANVNTGTFVAPASGSVLVTASLTMQVSASTVCAFGVAEHGGVSPLLANSAVFKDSAATTPRQYAMQFLVTGLTAGSSHNLDLLFAVNGANTLTVIAQGTTSTTPTATAGSPVTMAVQAV